jgi:Winged helix DNA-binding domain
VLGDGTARDRLLADPEDVVQQVVRLHLSCYGPASRHDIAWWTGLGLRRIDTALASLGPELTVRPGPLERDYWDLADGMPEAVADVGTHLLPEFDATLVGYDPVARGRFVSPEHHAILWAAANGLLLAPVLHEGRLVGYWRLEGAGRSRHLAVRCFEGCPRPSADALSGPAARVTVALGLEVADVSIGVHPG